MAQPTPASKLKYFDDNAGWTDRKPANLAAPNLKNFTVCNVDLHHSDVNDIERFNELLTTNMPAMAIVHNVTPGMLTRIKNGVTARKNYCLLETSKVDLREESTVALLRLGLQCEPTEAPVKPEGKNILRNLIQLLVRIANGPTLTITVLNMEHNVTQQRRLMVANAVLKQSAAWDVYMLVTNVTEGIQHTDEVYREIQTSLANQGFVDPMEECLEKNMTTPWVMWTRSAKYLPVNPTAELLKGNEPRFLSCTIAARLPGGVAGAAAGSIAIPMPRSAKSVRTKSPSSATGSTTNQPAAGGAPQQQQQQPVLSDPAILSAEAAKSGTSAGSASGTASVQSSSNDIIMRLVRQQQQQQQQLQQHKWQLIHSFSLKGSEAKLTSVEGNFDVSNLFATAGDAIDALNSGALNWPADYCVVHNTVLCSLDIPQLDRQSFRRYARDSKNNSTLSGQIHNAIAAYTAGTTPGGAAAGSANGNSPGAQAGATGTSGQTVPSPLPSSSPTAAERVVAWSKPMRAEAEEYTAFGRHSKPNEVGGRREWSDACCTIVYQLTPREFKFDITQMIGLSKDNLKKAIFHLNRSKGGVKDPGNPLQDYPYDYALLYSVERQGYWLIAASNVPCDIVQCRMVA